jgi:hypothetical protein
LVEPAGREPESARIAQFEKASLVAKMKAAHDWRQRRPTGAPDHVDVRFAFLLRLESAPAVACFGALNKVRRKVAGVIVAGVIGVGGVTGIIGWGHVGSHDEEPPSVRDTPTHDVRPVRQMTPTYSDPFQPR